MIDYTDVTPESIAAAKAHCDRERRELERLTGCTILPDGRILPPKEPLQPPFQERPSRLRQIGT